MADAHTVVLRLGERRVYVVPAGREHERQRPIASFRVAIGRAEYPTPVGRFTVIEKVENPTFVQFDWDDPSQLRGQIAPGPKNPLGSRWVGFASVDGWKVGFHGTPHPELIGQAVSHGCVRMREEDVTRFYQLVDVGTAVVVTP